MSRTLGRLALELVVPLAVLAAWWVWSANAGNTFFPPLDDILRRFQQLWLFDRFLTDVVPSLINLAVGYTLAIVMGVGLGVAMALVRPVRWALEPVVHFLRSIPPVALVPILIVLLGFGLGMKLTTITLASLFPTLIGTLDGFRAVDPTLHEVGKAYRLTRRERISRVYVPAAMPQIFAGMQVSLQVAFVVMIASEMLGSTVGIGAQTILAQQSFAIQDMWAGILLLGVLGYLINAAFAQVQHYVLRWYYGARAQALAA